MRLTLFTLLFIFAATLLNAQTCKYISNTTSGMDGTRQVITAPYKLAFSKENGKVQVWSKLYQDSLVVLALVIESETISSLNSLDHVDITFSNSETESFEVMNSINPSSQVKEKYTVYLNLGKAQQDGLKEKSVQEIKFIAENGALDFPVKKKGANYIGNVIQCTLSSE